MNHHMRDTNCDIYDRAWVNEPAGAVDRHGLYDIARRVVDAHERLAQRLGVCVASALLEALQAAPGVRLQRAVLQGGCRSDLAKVSE